MYKSALRQAQGKLQETVSSAQALVT